MFRLSRVNNVLVYFHSVPNYFLNKLVFLLGEIYKNEIFVI